MCSREKSKTLKYAERRVVQRRPKSESLLSTAVFFLLRYRSLDALG